jgi:sterol desaturase/sphingolipid hydroxylase (fatty acid hydroxylase superfamily)
LLLLFELFLFAVGYAVTALTYYGNHRFIFHGKPPKWTPRKIKRLHKWYSKFHMQHHLNAFPNDDGTTKNVEEYLRVPFFAKVLASITLGCISFLSLSLAAGILAFFIAYGIRHGTIHGINVIGFKPLKKDDKYYRHHMSHHTTGNWNKFNFSGVHPIIDRVFGTYSET